MTKADQVSQKQLYDELRDFRLEINQKIDTVTTNYVTRAEFLPVKLVVYGLVGTILTTVLGLLLSHAVQAN